MTPIPYPTHYEILGLQPSLQNEPHLTAQTLRAAYRRALLLWHPDKSQTNGSLKSSPSAGQGKFSIDQISSAYSVLGDPKARADYDEELKANKLLNGGINGNGGVGENKEFRTGIEVVDLDDLGYDETSDSWYRGCRCGEERGFEVREEDLEHVGDEGEVVVGCRGCSLWLRVLFGIVEEHGAGVQEAHKLDGKDIHDEG